LMNRQILKVLFPTFHLSMFADYIHSIEHDCAQLYTRLY
jgi:hypothetical protein